MNTNKKIGYIITESTIEASNIDLVEKGRRVIGRGRLQTADEVNRNRRIYELSELTREINCARTKELLEAGYMRAESGHPMSKELSRQQTIDPSNTCAIFKTLEMKELDVIGTFIGTNNALGEAFDQDLRDGYKPAWSLRALGSIEETPKGSCVRNLRLITYDHVIYPSHPNAYTIDLVSESTDMTEENNLPSNTIKLLGNTVPEELKHENGLIIPFKNADVIDCLQRNSDNFKRVQESFELLYNNIVVNESGIVQMTTSDGDIACITLENYVHNELMNYFYK